MTSPGDTPATKRGEAIRTHELSKKFGDTVAVDQVTMTIPRGSIFGFIGPSGCGKTTTMRLLLGIYQATGGVVEVLGRSPDHFTSDDRQRIGYMPQLFVMYRDLTIRENLNFAASLYGMSLRRHQRLQAMLELVELDGHEHKLARNISGGMLQRLSLAAALVHDPELIFLDEPTAGIDPVLRNKFWEHFKHLQSEGRTMFITTQYVGEAAYCDYVGVMSGGRLLMVAKPEELRRRALGGDVINVKPAQMLNFSELRDLRGQSFVREGKVTINSDLSLQLVVDDTGTALPAVFAWMDEHDIGVESAGEYNPPFDDVFVMLLEQERAREESHA
ncbi:MAG: ABC transporter ATP-binding protein [Candidatus Promineofilum sp.]|nr:ABC transporter ATP-binding protein [Promineifilum sp.]